MADERPYSSLVVDGVEQAPSRAMLYPTGFKRRLQQAANWHCFHLEHGDPMQYAH